MNNSKMMALVSLIVFLTFINAWSGEWTQKNSGATPRLDHSTVISNGKIYIFGGANNNPEPDDILKDLWEYDMINDNWVQKSNGPEPRDCHSAEVYNGKMYVFGGWYNIRHNNLWEYDISNDIWTVITVNAPPPERNNHMAVVYNGKMYVFGGRTGEDDEHNLNDLWEYNFIDNQWIQKMNAPLSIRAGSAVVYNNKMYIFGGVLDNENLSNNLLEYDFMTDKWTQRNNAPFSNADHSAIIYNNKMFVFGGGISDCANNILLSNMLLEYNFLNDIWNGQTLGHIPNRYAHTLNYYNGKMYVYGGKSENFSNGANEVLYKDLWEYEPNEIYDVSGDGKTGLEESIHILKIVSGIEIK